MNVGPVHVRMVELVQNGLGPTSATVHQASLEQCVKSAQMIVSPVHVRT